ncbi:cuticle protein AMP1A-like [Macrobrachium nipponense]|uniref:cuticle protein AMP1A-like n=1 Tax=Macrobrachium nipponense TaxID=159736 RepID=UPI0030C845F7
MKIVIIAALATIVLGAPQYSYDAPRAQSQGGISGGVNKVVAILRDDRDRDDLGRYSVNVETANGIALQDSGSPDGPKGAVVASGSFSYTSPEGIPVHVRYVADENGFQPQSDLLPVAPEFPHPIPQFVLDQIAFAAQEDARQSKQVSSPSGSYGAPPRYN